MLSKLTFSLALVLMLAFAATSVMAQAVPTDAIPGENAFGIVTAADAATTATVPGPNGLLALTASPVVGPASATAAIRNLEDLLRFGGSIELTIVVPNADADPSPVQAMYTAKIGATADDLATLKHRVIISEIMWGMNASLADETDSQWIELYNNGDAI